jgi:hypothetical protein
MSKSATELMQEIIFSAVLDAIAALKASSKGLPNTLLRDLNAIHQNTTFADLPKELQAAINGSVPAAFTRLMKEGYAVGPRQAAPARPMPPRTDGPPRGPRGPRDARPGGPRRDREGGERKGPRPPRKPPAR